MEKNIYYVLDIIEKAGYKAFLVGGFVRDYIWGKNTKDIDLCTNAPSSFLLDSFSQYSPKLFKYDSIKFNIDELHFDISRIRREEYKNHELCVRYTDNVYDDYLRRDFTFNGIYMNKNEHIFTFNNSYNDVINKEITFIGNSYERILEDGSRLLRYLYISLKNDLQIEHINYNEKEFAKYIKDKNNMHIVNFYLAKIKDVNKPYLLKEYLNILGLNNKRFSIFN